MGGRPILFVAGRFSPDGGRPSGYMAKLSQAAGEHADVVNGGTFDDLVRLIERARDYKALWWMPDVSNDEPKLVKGIKDAAPRTVLVISKNNTAGKYGYVDIVARMLAARANLSLVIETPAPFQASVLDPLGNSYALLESDPAAVGRALLSRTLELAAFTRTSSRQVGPARPAPRDEEAEAFYACIRGYAERFHELVHGANPSRFLGNAAFRCTKGGFPAFRRDGVIHISRRNIDKRQIGHEGFVAVQAGDEGPILYHGEAKPSVDAPIQRALFARLPWARYMMHAHVYVTGAPFTEGNVPCGATEEVDKVMAIASADASRPLAVNLRGHGCLVISEDVAGLQGLSFDGRPVPEPAA